MGDEKGGSYGTLQENSGAYRDNALAFNSDLYIKGDEYSSDSPYIVNQDGDGRGRDPQDEDINNAGTELDIKERNCMLARNKALYTRGNEYGAGSGNI